MCHSSECGWDPLTKKFTVSDQSHPNHKSFRTNTITDYEDLRIAIGNGTATRRQAVASGDDTDARTFGQEQIRNESLLDDLVFNSGLGSFIKSDQTLSLEHSISPLPSQPICSEVLIVRRKQNKTDDAGRSVESSNTQLDVIEKLTHTIDKLTETIDSIIAKEDSCWDIIKEIPNMDSRSRFKALKLLNTRAKKN
ncbi:hypothetical protein PTKIN_Ptkin04bG0101500 [Pterospermum kingtungense]